MPAKIVFPDLDDLARRYLAGESISQLARERGVNHKTLAKAFFDAGVEMRGLSKAKRRFWGENRSVAESYRERYSVVIDNLASLHERYLAGETSETLALEVGVCEATLLNHFHRNGLRSLSREETSALNWQNNREVMLESIRRGAETRRGRTVPLETRVRHAQTVYQRTRAVFRGEQEIADFLTSKEVAIEQQFAVGPYNLDLAVPELRFAVEVVGSAPNLPWRTKHRKRTEYFFDNGWFMAVVYLAARHTKTRGRHRGNASVPLTFEVATIGETIISLLDLTRRNQTSQGYYGVIGGDGQPYPVFRQYFDHFPRIIGF